MVRHGNSKVGRPMQCKVCGRTIIANSPRQLYCTSCAIEQAKMHVRESNARNSKNPLRKVACASCGEIFYTTVPSARRCLECRRAKRGLALINGGKIAQAEAKSERAKMMARLAARDAEYEAWTGNRGRIERPFTPHVNQALSDCLRRFY